MPIIGKQTPRGTTSFYDFSRNEEAQQPVAAAPVAPVANGAPVNTTPEQQYQSDVDKMVQWQQNTEAQRQANEQANPVATTTKNGNSSSSSSSNASSTSTKTTTTTVSPYEPFKGDNLGDIADYIKAQMDNYKPETKEEREKREKREKRLDFLSRLRDGLSSFHTAYSYARGVKPMDLTMMSPRARELFERAKAQRDKDADRRLNLTLVLQNLKDKERAWKYNVTKDETARADRQAAAAAQAEQAAAALKEKKREHDDNMEFQRGKAAQQAAQAAGELQEKVRSNKANERIKDAENKIKRAEYNLKKQAQDTSQYYTLGEGKGMVKIPKNAVNAHNFSAINNSLPKEYRAVGKPQTRTTTNPTTGKQEQEVIGYAAPTAQDMLVAVGAFLGDESIDASKKTVVRTALGQLGTKTGGNNKTMPGVK